MKVCIIGAGAAGMMAAHTAAKLGHKVILFDKMPRIGKKILATGGGRCNLTNDDCDLVHFHGGNRDFIAGVISEYSEKTVLEEFALMGLKTISKNGYVYPYTEQASSVLDILSLALKYDDVKILTECNITGIEKTEAGFRVNSDKGLFKCDRLILSAGSKASPKTGSDGSGFELAHMLGHTIIKPLPALCALRCEDKYFKSLAGIRCKGRVSIYSDDRILGSDSGEIQLTAYGISGIPVMQVSHLVAKAIDNGEKVTAKLSFLPKEEDEGIREFLEKRMSLNKDKTAEEFFVGLLHKNLAYVILKRYGISCNKTVREFSEKDILNIINGLTGFTVSVNSTNGFDECQVCQGGIDLNEVENTLESKILKGLYFAGEILDVHGDCGGYNLQWAWATGMLAGRLL